MSDNNIAELLRQGINAARDGDKAAARQLLEQVVDLDEKNEKGWFWLATVVDTDDERRVCLKNVLHINPNNERARTALEKLDAKAAKRGDLVDGEAEILPGVPRSQMLVILGGGGAVILVILAALLITVISNNNRIAAEQAATQQAIFDQTATQAQNTAVAAAATATADTQATADAAATQTQIALVSPTPTPSDIPRLATLPPTWTPTPPPTALPTRPVLPPPPSTIGGRIVAAGGREPRNTGYYPIGYYDLSSGGTYTTIGGDIGENPSFFPNGQRIVYARYFQELFDTTIDAININGSQPEAIPERWRQFETLVEPTSPRITPDGRLLIFAARPFDRSTRQIFSLDLSVQIPPDADLTAIPSPVRRVTNEEGIAFTEPAISPDGTRLVVVRTDTTGGAPITDLQLIDLATGAQTPVTSDLDAYVEAQPRWSPDGTQIIYATAARGEPENFDIVIRPAAGGNPSLLVRDPANDQNPVISPDGRYLAFSSNRSGAWDIYILEIATQTLYQLSNTPERDFPTDWWMP